MNAFTRQTIRAAQASSGVVESPMLKTLAEVLRAFHCRLARWEALGLGEPWEKDLAADLRYEAAEWKELQGLLGRATALAKQFQSRPRGGSVC